MRADYNPFARKELEETEHGIINYQHDMGTVYVTHRRSEHFFKKFQGFGISLSELEICYRKRVFWIIFLYHGKESTTIPYRIKLEDIQYAENYNNNGDIQKVVPTRDMETKIDGIWAYGKFKNEKKEQQTEIPC